MRPTHSSRHCVVLKVELSKCQSHTKPSNKNIQNNASTHLYNKTLFSLHKNLTVYLCLKGILNNIFKNTSSSQNTSFQIPHSVNNGHSTQTAEAFPESASALLLCTQVLGEDLLILSHICHFLSSLRTIALFNALSLVA